MKKLFALLLALCLLCSVAAFAEEAAAPYTINMDAIPEGYTMSQQNVNGDIALEFQPEAENMPVYFGSVAFSEVFDGYTLNIADLSEDDKAQVAEMFGADYNNPTFDFTRKTTHGSDLIIMQENGAETDSAEIVTIWQGYFITIGVYGVEEITEDMLETAITILSDLWVVAE